MKTWLSKGMLAAAISFPMLSGSTGQAVQQPQGHEERGIEGVWDVSVTGVSCATGAPIFTDPHGAILMFIEGGALTEIADRANRSTGLGTWRHLGGRSYTALEKWFEYTATGSFNGTTVITREIELSKDTDEYTATATTQVYNAMGQLINTGCATATATRFE
jgi:hypothetical protein